jgi:pilus assembly protein CpaE
MQIVLIVEKDASFGNTVRDLFKERGDVRFEIVPALADLAETVGHMNPDVVLFGPSIDHTEALAATKALVDERSSVAFVLVAAEVSTELLRQAMRSGLSDVVSAHDTYGDVAKSVTEALASASSRRAAAGKESSTTQPPDGERKGRVATVFSTKGGVGKTVIASNLGVALATLKQNVVLVDLDLQFGDTGIVLNIPPERTIFDAVQAFDRLDAEMIKGYLSDHDSGLKVLLAPIRPEEAECVTVSRLGTIIGLLQEVADYVVIDTAASFDDVVLAAIDRSDAVYAVATMDVASIKNTRVSLQKLAQMGYDGGKVHLVLNRADSKVWLDPAEVEKTVEGPVVAKIPSDRLVPRSVNRGVPVVLDSPRSAVARSLVELAQMVARSGKEASR